MHILVMALECYFLIYFIMVLFCSSGVITDKSFGISETCRVHDRSDEFGKAVFCTKFNSNLTSYSLPSDTTRLQIYGKCNISPTLPVAPNLNFLTMLEIISVDIQVLSSEMFDGLHNLTTLSLKNNRILKLSEDLFKNNFLLSVIDLSKNYLLSFGAFTKALKNLNHLTEIDLSENKVLRYIFNNETEALKNLSIQTLNLADCAIEVIEKTAFENFHSLSFLDISMNPLGEEATKNLSQSLNLFALKTLRATDMKFTAYFSNFFLKQLEWSSVEKLDLSNNKFTNFPRGFFPNLKQLILKNCDINILLPGSLSEMPSLEVLSMQRHQITGIGIDIFHNNHNLTTLDLSDFTTYMVVSRESLTVELTIDDYSFKSLKKLEILNLRRTPLKGILRRYMLFGLANLKKLDFHNCAFESIQENAFETLNSLMVLDLSSNSIYELSDKAFYGLQKLKDLNLSTNKLTSLESKEIFMHTPKLELLSLNFNRIQSLPVNMFLALHSIEMIQISDNFIRPWSEILFQNNPNLTVFIFARNAINYFTPEMLQDVSFLEFVDFSENPIDCSFCSTLDLQAWMNVTNVTLTSSKRGFYNYDCSSPISLKEHSIVDVNLLDLKLSCAPYVFDFLKFAYSLTSCCIFLILISAVIWYKWKWNIKYMVFSIRTKTKRFKEHANAKRYEFDAFVSYCEKDLPWVSNQLIPAIEGNDPNTVLCLLDRNFCAGNSVFETINVAVERSRTTILVLSNAYMNSDWNMFEIHMAQSKLFADMRSGLILIFLEPIQKSKITKNLRYVIKTRTCLQWTKNITGQKLFWERLKLAIKKPDDKGISTHII